MKLITRLRRTCHGLPPFRVRSPSEEIKEMYWRYGQRILAAGKIIKEDPRLYAVYITNFGCGPDSFIGHFFRGLSKGKPYLQLEIDEHSADAGAITRCEAFLDSLKNVEVKQVPPFKREKARTDRTKKIYIPYMCDHSFAVAAAFKACGVDADVFPESDEETLYWGRKLTSGKECYPCILTTGDMVKLVKDPHFDHQQAAFFMPSGNGPCRLGQYHRFHRLVLDDLGFHHVPIYSPNQDETLYSDLGIMGSKFTRLGWQGIVAVDLLMKKQLETRYATAASRLAMPDAGLVSLREMVDHAAAVVGAVEDIPVLADAENGFGNAATVWRTAGEFERAGIAGIHIEDHEFGKHLDVPGRLLPRADMTEKIRQLGPSPIRTVLEADWVER